MEKDYERIHNGCLSLLGILMAVFIFSFLGIGNLRGLPADQLPYQILNYSVGGIVFVCGLLAIWANWMLSRMRKPINIIYTLLLMIISITPFVVWTIA